MKASGYGYVTWCRNGPGTYRSWDVKSKYTMWVLQMSLKEHWFSMILLKCKRKHIYTNVGLLHTYYLTLKQNCTTGWLKQLSLARFCIDDVIYQLIIESVYVKSVIGSSCTYLRKCADTFLCRNVYTLCRKIISVYVCVSGGGGGGGGLFQWIQWPLFIPSRYWELRLKWFYRGTYGKHI